MPLVPRRSATKPTLKRGGQADASPLGSRWAGSLHHGWKVNGALTQASNQCVHTLCNSAL